MMFFHVAPSSVRQEIAEKGLQVEGEHFEEQTPGVYVWEDLPAAQRCVREFEKIREIPHDIWAVATAGAEEWMLDPLTMGRYSPTPVGPEYISLHTEADWEDLYD